jgi:hypothetical protein
LQASATADSHWLCYHLQAIQQKWKDLSFTVDRVCFISRAGFLDPYVIRHSVGLGQGQSKEVNVPYIATVGPWDASSLTADLVSASLLCCHQPASNGRCTCDTSCLASKAHVQQLAPGGLPLTVLAQVADLEAFGASPICARLHSDTAYT